MPPPTRKKKPRGRPPGEETQAERAFVKAVADGLGIKAAANVSGYKPGNESEDKLPAKIQKAIASERELTLKASMMTKKKVIDGLLEAIDISRLLADPTPMIQGWTQIAKMCGFMEPTRHKLEVSVNGQVVIERLQQLDDEQLLALADGRSDVLEGQFTVVGES